MDLFDLAAKITLDTSEYEKGLNEASSKTSTFGSKLGSGLATAGKVAGAALVAAGTAVGMLVTKSVQGYAQYEQLVGGVETLYGTSADKIMAYAEQAYQTAGMSSNQYMETATSFAAALVNSLEGDTDKAAQMADMAISDMADNVNKMGSSTESVQNAYNGFAKGNFTMLDNLNTMGALAA